VTAVLATDVFHAWDRAGIRYCLWKGSFHLEDSLDGRSDLDVLVDAAQLNDAQAILLRLGCRPGRVAPARDEVGVEDFLGIQPETRQMVHFHMYSRLIAGEGHHHRFRLPWERHVLDTRTEIGDVYVADPAVEAALLLIRSSLRLTWVGRSLMSLGFDAGVVEQLDWLLDKTEPKEVLTTVRSWLGGSVERLVKTCVMEGPTPRHLAALRVAVADALASQSSVSGLRSVTRRWWRTFSWARRGVYRRFLERPVFLGRRGRGGGVLVAVIGADGSGKSTLARDLRTWFAPKLDVVYLYMGSGDGPSSLIRWPMRVVHRTVLRAGHDEHRKALFERRHPGMLGAAKTVWALALAREKERKLRKAMVARNRGLLVICDRYPQLQFSGQNDGPFLRSWRSSASPLRRYLAAVEGRPYQLSARFVPDLVLRLNVDEAAASSRRPELDPGYLRRRIELVHSLRFDGSLFGVVDIDATRPYPRVFADAAEAIWSRT
jgi:hypothetical protein